MKKHAVLASLLLILIVGVLSACGSNKAANNTSASANSDNKAAANASPSTANTTAEQSAAPEKPAEPIKVKIGVSGTDGETWPLLKKKAKEQLNVEIELVEFSDYTLPNLALANKEVDVNSFQHLAFLSQFNIEHNLNIVPIGSTVVSPLGLYSKKYKDVSEIPDGSQIAIPNDPANQGRGLLVLQAAGLLKLKDNVGLYGTPDDIVDNPHKLKIVPVVAQQTPRVLPDVAASIINGGIAGQAGLKLSDAIFHDDPLSETTRPYLNVFATRVEDKDNETYRAIAKLYQDPEIIESVKKDSNGGSVVIDIPAETLQGELDKLEGEIKAAKK
ncbi:lipoprotein [Paenibacillus glycanilyticus]|uniref:Lipoprotein n=1 Tax=Paenibacillus glycanilyticus TaxID=126569 RepID=A0ABQ6NPA0_9BACL|nr:MetQ/NlpA family ABC transporter substrate-binding protein [Paenibacillus glycanilyticus]GMK45915.1 lipoprotein [Paenibacillus glycanilyticus]